MSKTTRDNAHQIHKASGKASTQYHRIYGLLCVSKYPLLRDEIADRLGIKASSVCGRLDELKRDGLVFEDAPRLNPFSGIECATYRPVREGDKQQAEDQHDLFGVAA